MSESDTEIVEHLVAMRAQLDAMNSDALDLVRRMDGLIEQLSAISDCADRIDSRLCRIENRLERIGMKLH